MTWMSRVLTNPWERSRSVALVNNMCCYIWMVFLLIDLKNFLVRFRSSAFEVGQNGNKDTETNFSHFIEFIRILLLIIFNIILIINNRAIRSSNQPRVKVIRKWLQVYSMFAAIVVISFVLKGIDNTNTYPKAYFYLTIALIFLGIIMAEIYLVNLFYESELQSSARYDKTIQLLDLSI